MSRPVSVERTETIQAEPAVSLAQLLDVDMPDVDRGGLPLLWHWLYLLERPAQRDLGADGHPVRCVIPEPPGQGKRRMWAGGRVRRHAPLRLGLETTRRTEVVSRTHKRGRTGRLTFVVVRHQILQAGLLAVEEEQDIVYREAPDVTATPEPTPLEPVPLGPGEWEVAVDPLLLFRFSALTYNAHRIHYDREYAREVEGYPGLVTHGPLQALFMAESVRRSGAQGVAIDYRLVAPLIDHQGLVVGCTSDGDVRDTTIRDVGGRITARGRAEVGHVG
jgi:3-methylfumaryl-CoA hydratase